MQTRHCTKMKFYFKDFFSKCDQIRRFLRLWSHFLKKSLMENFIFCAVRITPNTDTFYAVIVVTTPKPLTLFRMGFFGAAHGSGGGGGLPKISHTYPTMIKLGTVIPYLRKIQKKYKSRDTSFEFCWHQHFFTWNQQILLHQETQIWTGFWFINSNYFYFSWVFHNCFNKHGYNLNDVSKTGYSRPS